MTALFANSGLVVTITPEGIRQRPSIAGVELQRRYESAAFELAGRDYLARSNQQTTSSPTEHPTSAPPSSYERGTHPLNLSEILPPIIADAIRAGLPVMDQKWNGEYLKNATLVGPEMRGSSPVRIQRDRETWQPTGWGGVLPQSAKERLCRRHHDGRRRRFTSGKKDRRTLRATGKA